MCNDRLEKQISFIKEIEKLKCINRQNMTIDKERPENSAEHSWHVALMAVVLGEYSNDRSIDLYKVVMMLLIHDLVEIDGGDTWLYDEKANESKVDKEQMCAERVFGILPEDQKSIFIDLWKEFEERETKEAIFAASLDGMQPLINHLLTGNGRIQESKLPDSRILTASRIIKKKEYIQNGSTKLWEYSKRVINDSLKAGLYEE